MLVSKTMLSRLAMFEALDAGGPMTVTELAQSAGMDVTVVSRTVSACEPDGWVVRLGNRVAIGPRCTLLGHSGRFADTIAAARPLVHALAGATGLTSHAYGLVGNQSVLLATAAGLSPAGLPGLGSKAPLYATAAGQAIAVQLGSEHLTRLLPPEPFPPAAEIRRAMLHTAAWVLFADPNGQPSTPTSGLPTKRSELELALAQVSADGRAVDEGALEPSIHCIAVPWPNHALPAALACIGPPATVAAASELVTRLLGVAVQPGADAQTILRTAADEGRA